jgi:zinc D-Ala-D-Ala carboxypeptidase
MRRPDVALAAFAGLALLWAPPAGPRALAADAPVAAASVATPVPLCRYDDLVTRPAGYGDWAATIVDTAYRLPRGYAPRDLVPVSRSGLAGSGLVRRFVVSDLSALVRAARAARVPLVALSGYRSFDSQAWSFADWVRKKGYEAALGGSARAGHSEHQLGTALDFTSWPGVEPWYFVWFASPTARWLAANAWRYGFVMSYPRGEDARSCYHHEPWHYRYVGRAVAAAVHAAGVPLRAYLWTARAPAPPPRRPPSDGAGGPAATDASDASGGTTPTATPSPSPSPSPTPSSPAS